MSIIDWSRRQVSAIVALVLLVTVFQLGKLPSVSADEGGELAAGFEFTPLAIAMPAGLPTQSIRSVNQAYEHIRAWISSVGAGIAMNDLDGDGLSNDLCITDPRIDEVAITATPGPGADRYPPFVLDPAPLPYDRSTMAPMGCVPGDFNADGRMDLLVYYWGRTPIIFLARDDATGLSAAAYWPVELVPGASSGGHYVGPQWNSNAAVVADFDGDGYEDILIGNYFPDSPVLDETVDGGVSMNASLSYALNGGESRIYRWTGATTGPEPTVSYEPAAGALPADVANGWMLAASAVDLDGDLLPELYLAHDFGPDRLLYNRSTVGDIAFELAVGAREALVPKSKVLGRSSFKGMGVDFGDLNGDGLYDIFVSNITTSYGIHESNFAFINTAADRADLREQLARGEAPFDDRSAPLGMAWTGWGWDVKLADLNNSGDLEVVQATGFVKGRVNRWPQLQELAATNDGLTANPYFWPHVREGDDIAGDQTLAFFTRSDSGRYVDVSAAVGLAVPVPTRGIALGDATGDGRLDLAVARQWDAPAFYRNDSGAAGASLGLRLIHETGADATAPDAAATGVLPAPGSPVVGAQVTVTTPDGRTLLGRVDGGGGHSGKRSHEVFIGLGEVDGPVSVHLAWRDRAGQVHEQQLQLTPGRHVLSLGTHAQEVTS